MNAADSQRVAATLEALGYTSSGQAEQADVIVLNTCVVRQSAEDKAIGRLTSLKGVKRKNPRVIINLMGCMVGIQGSAHLAEQYPYVDVFSPPSDPLPLVEYLMGGVQRHETRRREAIDALQDEESAFRLPASSAGKAVSVFLPAVLGCSHACSYCVIPLRRGREASRKPEEILADARKLVSQGVKEVTLLGQIIDRYGLDLEGQPSLSQLLRDLHAIEELARIRFLTSHPNWMYDELLDTVASLPKVMPHFELPIQAGDDGVLRRMRRGYSVEKFMFIVEKIRARFDDVSIATDLIVGFPGESEAQFKNSVHALERLRPDMTHAARYSPRPGTASALNMEDDVPPAEKMRRFRVIEKMQERISSEINLAYVGRTSEVLFEGRSKNRWRGRTPTNKLVFAESEENLLGQVRMVRISWAGPWSMIGTAV
jgi:tRNA-2-methylthio-N6-dimethylallyladenosine synthase